MKKIAMTLIIGLCITGSSAMNAQGAEDVGDVPVIVTDEQVERDDDILND